MIFLHSRMEDMPDYRGKELPIHIKNLHSAFQAQNPEIAKCYPEETVQLLPFGDYATKKCVLVQLFALCYPDVEDGKDKPPRESTASPVKSLEE